MGHRQWGRPKRRWIDCVGEHTEAVEASDEDIQEKWKD